MGFDSPSVLWKFAKAEKWFAPRCAVTAAWRSAPKDATCCGRKLASPIIPLIMCGGAGTRLWPASREGRPKQFLRLFGQYSTFQETMRRAADPPLYARPIVITHHQYRFQIAEQLGEINLEADILLEPLRRDSAPAIAAGSAFALGRGDDAIVLALAADHVVLDVEAFAEVCRLARATAEKGMLVTFGI